MAKTNTPHLFLKRIHTSQNYKITPRNIPPRNDIPARNRNNHGNKILSQLEEIRTNYSDERKRREKEGLPTRKGEYYTFNSKENNNLKIESLDSSGAYLLNVKYDKIKKQEEATLFIPSLNLNKLIKKVEKYSDPTVERNYHNELVSKIENVSKSTIENLWSSPLESLPKKKEFWCELWFDLDEESFYEILDDLYNVCELYGIGIIEDFIFFTQRTIVVVRLNYTQLKELIKCLDFISEIRKAEELNEFWLKELQTLEREEWLKDALKNTTFTETNNYVTILDTGVNNGHILIEPLLEDHNKLTINENWGRNDVGGHGTKMAGVIAYGNLNSFLENNNQYVINHRLESVKIIPSDGYNENNLLPLITQNGVYTAIANNPKIKRIYCFANTGDSLFDFGRPSTWSAVIDKITYGEDKNDKKIFVVSAGNLRFEEDYKNYPESNYDSQIESPAQSWNGISVGAYTEKVLFDKDSTVAMKNELSPFSRTSCSWGNNWPIKPDIVFEGGNVLINENGSIDFSSDLDVLTTSSLAATNALTTFNATSAATAFACNFLAKLRSFYPEAWEETLRGLLIHSANWTDAMKRQVSFNGSRDSIRSMLRTFGYGVPNFEKASSCGKNYLTFICEEEIKPYRKSKGDIKTNDIHFYKFPWPKEILRGLGELDVVIKVTLSYFIEPNPGEKGYTNNYSYQSAGLRFSLMPPNDTPENFMLRINNAAREEYKERQGLSRSDKLPEGTIERIKNVQWELGADNVFKGSVHSNYLNTSAAEASASNYIAVYPITSGWWKTLKRQNKYDSKLKYSLIVSIETPENTTDIYTEIANQVKLENIVKI